MRRGERPGVIGKLWQFMTKKKSPASPRVGFLRQESDQTGLQNRQMEAFANVGAVLVAGFFR